MDLDANSLLLSLAVSSVGFVLFAYGKKQGRFPQMIAGAILMIYPYFVSNLVGMSLVFIGIIGALWASIRFGA